MTQLETTNDDPMPARTRWSFDRVARLGFLVGQGFDARHIAADPMIASTRNNVHRQVHRFGLAFREAIAMRLPQPALDRLDAAAIKRGLTRGGLIREVLLAAASDAALIDNILDDGA
jgi:hypothetical protein